MACPEPALCPNTHAVPIPCQALHGPSFCKMLVYSTLHTQSETVGLWLSPSGQSSGPVSLEDRISVNDATPPTMLTPLPRATRNVEEEETVHQTEDVEVCRAPRWVKREFKFSVGSQQCYLNVCVYDRLASEDKGELLIGHVSLPLVATCGS